MQTHQMGYWQTKARLYFSFKMVLFVSYGYILHNCPMQFVRLVIYERFFPFFLCMYVKERLGW